MEVSIKVEIKPEWPMPSQSVAESARRSMIEMKFKKLSFETEGLVRSSLIKVMREFNNDG